MFGIPIGMLLLIVGLMIAGWLVSRKLKKKFEQYSQQPISTGMSGKDIAEQMLKDNGIQDVKITSVEGHLTDHYNPSTKTVNLSPNVHDGTHVAAAAVAAHECGHAVQHANAYSWLQLRSTLVPAVSASSRYIPWLLIGGILTVEIFPWLMLTGIILFALTTLFSFVTLPVEIDASNRALAWLDNARVTASREHEQAKDALWWAAMTYVVAALSSLATLLSYVMIFMGARD